MFSLHALLLVSTGLAQEIETGDLGPGWEWVEPPDWESTPMGPAVESPEGIYGGTDVAVGDRVDTVGILYAGGVVNCTGTLIAPNLVLTAGHCMGGVKGAVIGSHDLSTGAGERIRASAKARYPDYWNVYDVGILLLERDSIHAHRVIARDCILDDFEIGAPLAIAGFGAIDEFGWEYVPQMREAEFEVADDQCLDTYCNDSVFPDGEFIGRHPDGETDTCYGDSGGPAHLITDDGEFLLGVTSRSTWPGGWKCGSGTLFVRADAVVPWIESLTGVALDSPDCPPPPPPESSSDLTEGNDPTAPAGCSATPFHPWSWLWLAAVAARRSRR